MCIRQLYIDVQHQIDTSFYLCQKHKEFNVFCSLGFLQFYDEFNQQNKLRSFSNSRIYDKPVALQERLSEPSS